MVCSSLVLDEDVVGLSLGHVETLVLCTASSSTTAAVCCLLYCLAVDLEEVAVIGVDAVLHLACEGCRVLACDTDGEILCVHAVSESVRTEGREVELVVVSRNIRISCEILVVVELYIYTLSVVEFMEMCDCHDVVVERTYRIVIYLCTRNRLSDSVKEGCSMLRGRGTCIVSVEEGGVMCIRTYDCDLLEILGKRKDSSLVLEEYHCLSCCLYCKLMMLFTADHIWSDVCPWEHFRRVEHTKLETAVKCLAEMSVKHIFSDETLFETFLKNLEHSSALKVRTVEYCIYRS